MLIVSGQLYATASVQILISISSPKSSANGETVMVCPVSSTIAVLLPKQQVSACVSNSARLCVVDLFSLLIELIRRDHTAAQSHERWVAWVPKVLERDLLGLLLELVEVLAVEGGVGLLLLRWLLLRGVELLMAATPRRRSLSLR